MLLIVLIFSFFIICSSNYQILFSLSTFWWFLLSIHQIHFCQLIFFFFFNFFFFHFFTSFHQNSHILQLFFCCQLLLLLLLFFLFFHILLFAVFLQLLSSKILFSHSLSHHWLMDGIIVVSITLACSSWNLPQILVSCNIPYLSLSVCVFIHITLFGTTHTSCIFFECDQFSSHWKHTKPSIYWWSFFSFFTFFTLENNYALDFSCSSNLYFMDSGWDSVLFTNHFFKLSFFDSLQLLLFSKQKLLFLSFFLSFQDSFVLNFATRMAW